MRRTALVCALGVALLAMGAARADAPKRALQPIETTLIITRVDDVATLQWDSDARAYYTVLYATRRDAKAHWQPLPGCVRIRGTGERITITDKIPPGETRYYRLHVEPISFEASP